MSLRIVFMGSPEAAVPSFKALLSSREKVVGVVSQPDRPVGRHQEMTPPAMARLAKEAGLPLLQPEKIKGNTDFISELKKLAPDLIVIVAYGKILPPEVLKLPPMKCINLHFSLLPKYRGAAPVQWVLINDESETGVTTFVLVDKLDAGPILLQKKIVIEPEDNAEILGRRLAIAGSRLLIETIDRLQSGQLDPIPQNERLASEAPPLKKEDGLIDWSLKAKTLWGQVRGMFPWPGAYTYLEGQLFKIFGAEVGPRRATAKPGEVVSVHERGIEVACGQGTLLLKEIQLEGKKRMEADEFLKGHPLTVGRRLGK